MNSGQKLSLLFGRLVLSQGISGSDS